MQIINDMLIVKLGEHGYAYRCISIWIRVYAYSSSRSSICTQQIIYDMLDVKLEERGESFYNPFLSQVVADLTSAELLEESEGQCPVEATRIQVPEAEAPRHLPRGGRLSRARRTIQGDDGRLGPIRGFSHDLRPPWSTVHGTPES